MDSRVEEEKNRVRQRQLICLIKEEEKINKMILNELQVEDSFDIIFFNSQLAAEKAKLAYLSNVLLCKRNNEELDLNSIQMRLSTGSSDEHSNPFSEIREPSINESVSFSHHPDQARRFSERFSVNINSAQIDLQSRLSRCERKIEVLTENLEERSSTLEAEVKRTESLKELLLSSEEKLKKKELEICSLQSEMSKLHVFIDELEKARDSEIQSIKKSALDDLDKVKSSLALEKEKLRKSEEIKKEVEDELNCQIRDLTKANKNLQWDREISNKTILKLNEEIDKLGRRNEKIHTKLSKHFEYEKSSIEISFKSQIDELKFRIKSLEELQDMNSCSEHTDNELSELDEHNRHMNSEPYTLVTLDKKISYDSIKFLESFDPGADESLNSLKSQQVTISSTCQTESEFIDVLVYDILQIQKQDMEENLKSCRIQIDSLELEMKVLTNFINCLSSMLDFCCPPSDLSSLLGKVSGLVNSRPDPKNFTNQKQNSMNLPKALRKSSNSSCIKSQKVSLFFWRKTDPIVSSLFG